MIRNENLKALRDIVVAEGNKRLNNGGGFGGLELAKWLIGNRRAEVKSALEDLIFQAMRYSNDEHRVRLILRDQPDLRESERGFRLVSETLGVGLGFLLTLPREQAEPAFQAAELVQRLREQELVAEIDALDELEQMIEPITSSNPEMTAGEAFHELQRRTNETISGLEAGD